jgi:hypothetical protein
VDVTAAEAFWRALEEQEAELRAAGERAEHRDHVSPEREFLTDALHPGQEFSLVNARPTVAADSAVAPKASRKSFPSGIYERGG